MLKTMDRHHEQDVRWKVSERIILSQTNHKLDKLIEKLAQKFSQLMDDDLGAWSEIKFRLKEKFSFLSDEDLYFFEGKEDELISNLLQKIGYDVDNLKKILTIL